MLNFSVNRTLLASIILTNLVFVAIFFVAGRTFSGNKISAYYPEKISTDADKRKLILDDIHLYSGRTVRLEFKGALTPRSANSWKEHAGGKIVEVNFDGEVSWDLLCESGRLKGSRTGIDFIYKVEKNVGSGEIFTATETSKCKGAFFFSQRELIDNSELLAIGCDQMDILFGVDLRAHETTKKFLALGYGASLIFVSFAIPIEILVAVFIFIIHIIKPGRASK